jgi:hypothetical protein
MRSGFFQQALNNFRKKEIIFFETEVSAEAFDVVAETGTLSVNGG